MSLRVRLFNPNLRSYVYDPSSIIFSIYVTLRQSRPLTGLSYLCLQAKLTLRAQFIQFAMIRLLTREHNGELVLREFDTDNLPAYAILSHTWGLDSEEVNFQDLEASTGKSKAGYGKLLFCERQACINGLQYFWIDTCCINKRNDPELSEAINSMFRWYQKAARGYVYLSDVARNDEENSLPSQHAWESDLRRSRWFTRGWTLQELIAPRVVEFFTLDCKRLGDKLSLETIIYEVTGIAKKALRGHPLSDFSVQERMLWAAPRSTKREEDQIYSLLGIFDVSMPLIYGEGRDKASRRLHEEVNKSMRGKCFSQIRGLTREDTFECNLSSMET
jgi:hypothetical protein